MPSDQDTGNPRKPRYTENVIEDPPDSLITKVQQYEQDFPSLGETSQWSEKKIKDILQRDKKPGVSANNTSSSDSKHEEPTPLLQGMPSALKNNQPRTNGIRNTVRGANVKRSVNDNYQAKNASSAVKQNHVSNVNHSVASMASSRFYSSWDASETSGCDDDYVPNPPFLNVGPSGDSSTTTLKYYATESKVRHATSVVNSWLYDMMCEELAEEDKYAAERKAAVRNECSAGLTQHLEELQKAFVVHDILYEIDDFEIFTRNRYAYPAVYLEAKLQISGATLLEALKLSNGELIYDCGLVRRTIPLSLTERVILQYNPKAKKIPYLREERPHVLKELLEFYFSPEGLPESGNIGQTLITNSNDMTVEQCMNNVALNRIRASHQEILEALKDNNYVTVMEDQETIHLVNPLSDETIDAIRKYPHRPRRSSLGGSAPATPTSSDGVKTTITTSQAAWPVNAVPPFYSYPMPLSDSSNFVYPSPVENYYPVESPNVVPIPSPSSVIISDMENLLTNNSMVIPAAAQPPTAMQLHPQAAVSFASLPPTQPGLKSGNRTRNPSNVSALCDENMRPDDIFISIGSEVEEGGDEAASNANTSVGTKRFAIPERILAKHPSGDRHSTFGKSRTRNSKRGAKHDTKEAIAAALSLGNDFHEEDDEVEEDDASQSGVDNNITRGRHKSVCAATGSASLLEVLPPSSIAVPASKVNVVDQKTFEEYRDSRRARSVSAQRNRNRLYSLGERSQVVLGVSGTDSPKKDTQDLPHPLAKNTQSGTASKPAEPFSDQSPPQIPPAPPVAPLPISPYSHLGYQMRVNPLLPVSLDQWYGHWHYIVCFNQYLCGNAPWLERPDLLPPADDALYFPKPVYTGAQSQGKDVEFSHALDALKRSTEQHAESEAAEKASNLPKVPVVLPPPPPQKTQSIHPLGLDIGDGHALSKVVKSKESKDGSNTFMYKPRARTASGNLIEMGTMHNKGRMYYDELLDRGLKDRAIKGYGKSQMMNLYYNIVRAILFVRFNRKIYETFKQYALEDDLHGARYGIQCLFYFYTYYLEQHFRNDLYMDFEHLVSDDVRNGKWYGCEKFWAFFTYSGKNPNTYVKDPMLLQTLQHFNTKEKFRSAMEVPHRFRIEE